MPEDPTVPVPQPTPELHGLDAGELLARGLNTAMPSGGASAWEPPTPEELAKLLPQYRIESLLGRGGMGAVYKGVQAALDRPVAIKLLPAEVAANGDFLVRFQREARTLAKLQHSGIVAVYDFGQTGAGHLYFVMEYVDGTDLQHIMRGPGLRPEQAFVLIGQICEALHYAHQQGVIHRDIKPANILVTKDGRAKVADFGLARPLTEETGGLTQTNMVMGTPDYMAPEQRTGDGHPDHRADIFALGVMLYEMLTGQRPHGAFQPPSHRVQVDVRIDEVVLKALQQEPDRRYQQASEMKTDVDTIRTTPMQTAARVEKKPGSTNRKPLAFAAMILLPLLALAALLHFEPWKKDGGARPPGALPSPVAGETRDGARIPPPATSTPPAVVVPAQAASGTTSAATKDTPFVNTLGMKFVPVPITGGPSGGQRVLFSIWETRVQDFAAYLKANSGARWRATLIGDDDHPLKSVIWESATAFCEWLTEAERAAGRIGPQEMYRLPTDHEWSCAVGIGDREDASASPSSKNGKITGEYPWGQTWPPPAGAGNYGEFLVHDGFADTSPVGSFAPNRHGIYDLGGNVSEWCADLFYHSAATSRVLRGSSWATSDKTGMESSHRLGVIPGGTIAISGFRCVLAPTATVAYAASIAPVAAASSPTPAPVPKAP